MTVPKGHHAAMHLAVKGARKPWEILSPHLSIQHPAIGITAMGATPTAGMATGVVRAEVMAMVILMGVMGMEVIRA